VADPQGNQDLHFKMVEKGFLIALHHGYVTCSHVSLMKQVNMAANEHGLFEYIGLSFFTYFMPVLEMKYVENFLRIKLFIEAKIN